MRLQLRLQLRYRVLYKSEERFAARRRSCNTLVGFGYGCSYDWAITRYGAVGAVEGSNIFVSAVEVN